MNVAFVTSEAVPFAKTGGLADVSGALPIELKKSGLNIKVFMPKYYSVDSSKYGLEFLDNIGEMKVRMGGYPRSVFVHKGFLPDSDVEIYFIECNDYFIRRSIYTNDFDEDERFMLFNKAVIELLQRLKFSPDVFHINDWQTAMMPLFLRDNYGWDQMFHRSAFVYTIHNIGYQGQFSFETAKRGEINPEYAQPGGIAVHNNGINFMKAGIFLSEIITTVSETYANELLTPEYGAGMDGYLYMRRNDLYGIINGVDYNIWSPENDKYIPTNYSLDTLSKKEENKKQLCETFGFKYYPNIPIIGLVSRMVNQKGFDLIASSINYLVNLSAQWIILGTGEVYYENLFAKIASNFSEKVRYYNGYNNELSHLIEAGADIFLMPSRYEPCGLNQIYSLKYGTVPVVRKTGGLADTVQDWDEYSNYGLEIGNGFSFNEYSGYALTDAIERALKHFRDKKIWKRIQTNGMNRDYSWEKSAKKYIELYNKAIFKKRG